MQVGIRSVRRRRLYEDIVQQFHSLIRQGVLQHGARLPSERMLAEQFNVSRSSVREAIRSLELQGLVVSRRGSGTFINTDDLNSVVALIASSLSSGADTLRDIFEMRHLLEPQIAFLAAQRVNPQELLQMEEILEEQGRQIARWETGVNAGRIREAARAFSSSGASAILYALDTFPQSQRVDCVNALVDLALLTGNVGRPHGGLYPLRPGTNDQGSWDVGCVPNLLPGYQAICRASKTGPSTQTRA